MKPTKATNRKGHEMTTITNAKAEIVNQYNALLDRFFAAATITESNKIQDEMGKVYWRLHNAGLHFKWEGNRVADIVTYAEDCI